MKGTIWCLHGAVGSGTDWHGFQVPGWKTQPIDLWRFIGFFDDGDRSMPGFAKKLNAEVRETTLKGNRVLAGYSMGARLALHCLLEADSPWDAAVLIAPNPGLETKEERLQRELADRNWARLARDLPLADFLAAWNAQPLLAASGPSPDRSILMWRREAIAQSFLFWSLSVQRNLWPHLAEIRVPVLWITGENDTKFRTLADRAVPLLPKGESWIAPGCFHRVPWEAPEAFAARVGEFLEHAVS